MKEKNFEEMFLQLPASRLAVALHEEKSGKKIPKKRILEFLSLSKRKLLAISAFLVAIGPLYQLNVASLKVWQLRQAINAKLATARELIFSGAMQDAKLELDQVKVLDASNPDYLDLSAVVELERLVRWDQAPISLKVLEVRFRETLQRDPLAAYLMGAAYIDSNLDHAEELLKRAERLCGENRPGLFASQASARIWILSQRFLRDSNENSRKGMDELYQKALKQLSRRAGHDFSGARSALEDNYAKATGKRPGETGGSKFSQDSFARSMEQREISGVGKNAMRLAEALQGEEDLAQAKALMQLAIFHAELAQDVRALSQYRYRLAELQRRDPDLTNAPVTYSNSFAGALKNLDYRLAAFSAIGMGKTLLVLDKTTESESALHQANALLNGLGNEPYALVECEFLLLCKDLVADKRIDCPGAKNRVDGFVEKTRSGKISKTEGILATANWLAKSLEHRAAVPMDGTRDFYFPSLGTFVFEKVLSRCK